MTALSRQFGVLGAILFAPLLKRMDDRRIARGPVTPEALGATRHGTLIPVAAIFNVELTKGFLSSTIRLSNIDGREL